MESCDGKVEYLISQCPECDWRTPHIRLSDSGVECCKCSLVRNVDEYSCFRPISDPLLPDEQNDLFIQMDKWLKHGGIRECHLLAPEMENVYRMRATVVHLMMACVDLVNVHDHNEWSERTEGTDLREVIDRIRAFVEQETG